MRTFISGKFQPFLVVAVFLVLIFVSGRFIAIYPIEDVLRIIVIIILAFCGLLVLRYPYFGLAIVVASLLVVDILPPVPLGSSIATFLGAATLLSFLFGRKHNNAAPINWGQNLVWAGLLIVWMIASNPSAALLPEEGNRNWIFTFVQLWLLAWLAAQLLKDVHSMHVLIWIFSVTALISALYALSSNELGGSIVLSDRIEGLTGGANTAARYFIIGLVFTYYLRVTTSNGLVRLLLLLAMGIFVLGTFLTASRTGLLLLAVAIGLFVFFQVSGRNQSRAIIIIVIVWIVSWFFADNILDIFAGIIPSIREGSDTVGLRYKLWEAGFRMWLDYPLQGVGIGLFREYLPYYGADLLTPNRFRLGAHNMYISMLVETGLVGLGLFGVMLFVSLRSLWVAARAKQADIRLLGQTWFIVFVVMLLGGITKHDHYDKLIWIVMGIASSSIWEKLPDEKN